MRGAGTYVLKSVAWKIFHKLNIERQIEILKSYHHLVDNIDDDWFLPLCHQVDKRSTTDIFDAYYYHLLCNMITDNKIYLLTMEMADFAQSDSDIKANTKLLECAAKRYNFDFYIKSSPQQEDGYIVLKEDKIFKRLLITDNNMPTTLEQITITKGTCFPLEIGTNPVSKFTQYLKIEKNIGRFPYKQGIINRPILALFRSIVPKYSTFKK